MDEQVARLIGRDEELGVLRRCSARGPARRLRPWPRRDRQVDAGRGVRVEARSAGATVLGLDGRAIEPTERGFLAALEAKTGGDPRPPRRGGTVGSPRGRVILVLDTYELFRVLDPWLRWCSCRPPRQRAHRPVRPRVADDRLAQRPWRALPRPAAREPRARRRRDPAHPGRRGSRGRPNGSTTSPAVIPCPFDSPPRRWRSGPTSASRR